jgi:hypothetical protein
MSHIYTNGNNINNTTNVLHDITPIRLATGKSQTSCISDWIQDDASSYVDSLDFLCLGILLPPDEVWPLCFRFKEALEMLKHQMFQPDFHNTQQTKGFSTNLHQE